jgi:hypothetical protein
MSAAGTYAYWYKQQHPNAIVPQMKSLEYQPAFYLGGSQVPVNLGIPTSTGGFQTHYISHMDHQKNLSTKGRGINTTVQKHHKVYLPKHMASLSK